MRVLSRLPLRAMLTLPFVGLVLLLAVVIGLLSYQAGRAALDTWSEQLLVETVRRAEQAIALHVSGSAAVLEAAFPAGVSAPAAIADDIDALRTRFWLATSVHRDLNNYAYYGDENGHFFGLWRDTGADTSAELRLRLDGKARRQIYRFSGIDGPLDKPETEVRTFEPRERPWYQAGQSARLHTWTSVYIDFRLKELVATRARRVPDRAGKFHGVVATDLSLQRIDDFVKRLSLSPNGIALIAEPDGKLIGVSKGPHLSDDGNGEPRRLAATDSPDPLVAATFREIASRPESRQRGEPRAAAFTTQDGRVIQVGYSRLKDDAGLDWLVMVAVPRDDFIHKVSESFRQSLGLGALAASVCALLGLWVLATIANELRALAAVARRIGNGDLSAPPATDRTDELGELARAFADMQSRLLTDQLTGLSNRTAALRRIEERILGQRRSGDPHPFALLFIDADGFKAINDQLGHEVGDRMLRELGQRIRGSVRATDMVARYAGDEFLVLINEIDSRADAEQIRTMIEERLREPVPWLSAAEAALARTGASIGLAMYPTDGRDVEALIHFADQDMYRRKSAARGGQHD